MPVRSIERAAVSPRVAVILVNWRASEMTLLAVARVLQQSLPPAVVYVVDNGSGDGSVERLESGLAQFGPGVVLLISPDNIGFGAGCNRALECALADDFDFVWLLNNDAEPAPDCLARLIATAAAAPQPIGIVGSRLIDPTGQAPDHSGSWLNPVTMTCGAILPGDPADVRRLRWMTAASLLVAIPALRVVGGFDPEFFMYWEDADMNMRVAAAGFHIVAASDAHVEHHAGTSSATIPVQRYLWHFRSQDRFLSKHHPAPIMARIALRGKFLLKAVIDRDIIRLRGITKLAFHWPV